VRGFGAHNIRHAAREPAGLEEASACKRAEEERLYVGFYVGFHVGFYVDSSNVLKKSLGLQSNDPNLIWEKPCETNEAEEPIRAVFGYLQEPDHSQGEVLAMPRSPG